ncbi:MAG TPA: four helix bundle protein [Nanoarchaeota archaeon]|nr:four helix bundle protein [Candidatus Pacearchaeota archaeon]HIH18270.1 four helix bundle protein [Nanoarchaeota archaeon]HIH34140.1 four helix bundle protein [Nanoarchaeota archaeon]HIH51550.1 four helix bundle protein [Nanoarchaeota archaeon]HIH65747.1 four helix bundle protein [Nanoarchaeota archaeon]
MANNFRNLEIWKEGYQLAVDLYRLTEGFPKENNSLISQIRRAAISIPLNIAEGCSRFSKNAFLNFLSYSYGSLLELEVLMHLSKDLNYMSEEEHEEFIKRIEVLSKMVYTFMYRVEKQRWLNWFKD